MYLFPPYVTTLVKQKRGRGRPPRKNDVRGDTKSSKERRMREVGRQSRAPQKAKRDAMKSDAVYDDDGNLISSGRGFAHSLCLGILTAPLLPSFLHRLAVQTPRI